MVQHRLLAEYDTLYAPIVGAADDYVGHVPVETAPNLVQRTRRLKSEYEDLKKDLTSELDEVQLTIIGPAQEAKDNLQIARKQMKKREDKKLDYERYQSRVDVSSKKSKLSDRDRAQLTKAQSDLAMATEAYHAADNHLRNYLPPLLAAVWSLQPYLLAAQIRIQNNLLAHYYTMLHNYCSEQGFPSPSPPMDEVVRLWEDAFRPQQRLLEAMPILASGKAIRKSISDKEKEAQLPPINGYRRPSQPNSLSRAPSISPARPSISPSQPYDIRPKLSHSPSSTSLLSPLPNDSAITSPSPAASLYQTPSSVSFSPAGPNTDYFSRDRQPSATSASASRATTPGATTPGGTSMFGILGKKKPPPPPPRIPSHHFQFVTALYDFAGQGDGDLMFKQGDKIKVLKKTDSTDDWWQGELKGVKGMFPANYVQV